MVKTAKDVMRTQVHSVEPDMSLVDFERFILTQRMGGAPVMEGGQLLGVISRSDIIRMLGLEQSMAEVQSGIYMNQPDGGSRSAVEEIGGQVGQRMQKLTVRDAMTEVRASVGPDASLQEVASAMEKHKVHRVLVLEGERLVGLISRIDLVKLIADGSLVEAPP